MFNGLFNGKSKINIPVNIPQETDQSFDNSYAIQAAQLLQQSNYSSLVQLYVKASGDDKSMILNKCCLTDQFGQAIEKWSLQYPDDFYSTLFHGVFLTYKAWQARSGAYAANISRDQATAFADYLNESYDLLYKCSELLQDQPEVYSRMIRVCMGLGDGESAENCFDVLMEEDEGHVGGHMFMYNLLTPKWLGTDKAIESFNEMAIEKTEQYPLLVVIPLMHMAERYNMWCWDNRKAASHKAKQQFTPHVKNWYNWFSERQQLHTEYTNLIHNYFAFLFHICGQEQERNKEINQLNVNIPPYPWSYIGITSNKEFWGYKW